MRSHRALVVLSAVAGWCAAVRWHDRRSHSQPLPTITSVEAVRRIHEWSARREAKMAEAAEVCEPTCSHGDECPCYGEGWRDAHEAEAHKVWQSYALEMRAALFTATADVVQILEDAGRRLQAEEDVDEVVEAGVVDAPADLIAVPPFPKGESGWCG